MVVERELVSGVGAMEAFALTLREPVGLADTACGAVIVAKDSVDGIWANVVGETFPCAIGDGRHHGGTRGMAQALVEPENVPKKLLLGKGKETLELKAVRDDGGSRGEHGFRGDVEGWLDEGH